MASFLQIEYGFPITFESNIGLRSQEARNLRYYGADIGAQRWEFLITLAPQVGQTAALGRLAAHRARHSRLNPFEIECPQLVEYPSNLTSNVLTSSNRAAGGTTVPIDSADSNRAAQGLPAGRFIRFNGHSKLYMVVVGRASNGNITIEPELVANVANNERIFISPNVRVVYDPSSPIATAHDSNAVVLPQLRLHEALQ